MHRVVFLNTGCACLLVATSAMAQDPTTASTPAPTLTVQQETLSPPIEEQQDLSLIHRIPQRSPGEKGGATRSFETLSALPNVGRSQREPQLRSSWGVGLAMFAAGTAGVLTALNYEAFDVYGGTNRNDLLWGDKRPSTNTPFSQDIYPAIMGVVSGTLLGVGAGLVILDWVKHRKVTREHVGPEVHVGVGPDKSTWGSIRYTW